jgi:hypothetical protein
MRLKMFGFVIVLLVLIVGCSGKIKVSGKVTFEDGTPLTAGEVRFESSDCLVSGKIQSDGSYQLGSASATDGIPKGSYNVSVFSIDESGIKSGVPPENAPPLKSLVAEKYCFGKTSGLVCDVNTSTTFDFTVEKAKQ